MTTKLDQISPHRKRPQYSHNFRPYHQLSIIKKLGTARFSVYLTFSEPDQRHYAMKLFPYASGNPHENYTNEARFAFLKHPNIINFVHCEEDRDSLQKDKHARVSYTLMEYAPYGDFFSFVVNHREQIDDRLARTYFRQLVNGIEYLHKNGIAHLDLKPENLLIGTDFNLKIIDFDLSYMHGDAQVLSRGTKYYRAPELSKSLVSMPFAADVYSAGIILFILKSRGMYPYFDNNTIDSGHLAELMFKNSEKFWTKHCELEERDASFYDSGFRELFSSMIKYESSERLTIQEVKQSAWYNGPVYPQEELCEKVKTLLSC